MTRALGIRSNGPVSLRDVRRNRAEFAAVKDRMAPVDHALLAELAANKAEIAARKAQLADAKARRKDILARIEADRAARRLAAKPNLAALRERNRRHAAQGRVRVKVRKAEQKDHEINPRRLTLAEWQAANASWRQRAIAADVEPRSLRSTV